MIFYTNTLKIIGSCPRVLFPQVRLKNMNRKTMKTQPKKDVKLKIRTRGIYALKPKKVLKRTPLIEIQMSEKH